MLKTPFPSVLTASVTISISHHLNLLISASFSCICIAFIFGCTRVGWGSVKIIHPLAHGRPKRSTRVSNPQIFRESKSVKDIAHIMVKVFTGCVWVFRGESLCLLSGAYWGGLLCSQDGQKPQLTGTDAQSCPHYIPVLGHACTIISIYTVHFHLDLVLCHDYIRSFLPCHTCTHAILCPCLHPYSVSFLFTRVMPTSCHDMSVPVLPY